MTSEPTLQKKRKLVLAVASGGGHWVQLMRIKAALNDYKVCYISTLEGLTVPGSQVLIVRDASKADKWGVIVLSLQMLWIILRLRPYAVVTTGAAPGAIALRLAKLFGIRTVWIDSIANVNELSLSGRYVEKYADLWLTQWADLATKYDGLKYKGSVL